MKKKNIIIIKYLAIGILVFLAINIPKMVISNKIIEGLESDESPSTEINTTGSTPSPSGEDINDLLQKLEDVEQPPINKERIIQCIQAYKNAQLYNKSNKIWKKVLKHTSAKSDQKDEIKKTLYSFIDSNFGIVMERANKSIERVNIYNNTTTYSIWKKRDIQPTTMTTREKNEIITREEATVNKIFEEEINDKKTTNKSMLKKVSSLTTSGLVPDLNIKVKDFTNLKRFLKAIHRIKDIDDLNEMQSLLHEIDWEDSMNGNFSTINDAITKAGSIFCKGDHCFGQRVINVEALLENIEMMQKENDELGPKGPLRFI
jgi:hypothetical protein